MKGAFLISEDPAVFDKIRAAVVAAGGIATEDDVAQLRDEKGNLLTFFGRIPPGTEWEWQQGPFTVHAQPPLPRMDRATACWIECRSERSFSAMVGSLVRELGQPMWVVDGDGALWSASNVDPATLRL